VKLILLTNDDGIDAEGLRTLEKCVAGLARTVIVAPDRERSAVSHGLTIRTHLEPRQIQSDRYALPGTPADCVIHALRYILTQLPDLVISGINHGANLSDDILYSGTVAAAREAARRGIPAVAVSQAYDEHPIRFGEAARFVRKLVRVLMEQKSNGGMCLNVNIPVGRIRGVRITRQGEALHFPHFNSLARAEPPGEAGPGEPERAGAGLHADFEAILQHCVSITPLSRDLTDYPAARALKKDFPRRLGRLRLPGIGLIG
jgi:5'-nucleotidase